MSKRGKIGFQNLWGNRKRKQIEELVEKENIGRPKATTKRARKEEKSIRLLLSLVDDVERNANPSQSGRRSTEEATMTDADKTLVPPQDPLVSLSLQLEIASAAHAALVWKAIAVDREACAAEKVAEVAQHAALSSPIASHQDAAARATQKAAESRAVAQRVAEQEIEAQAIVESLAVAKSQMEATRSNARSSPTHSPTNGSPTPDDIPAAPPADIQFCNPTEDESENGAIIDNSNAHGGCLDEEQDHDDEAPVEQVPEPTSTASSSHKAAIECFPPNREAARAAFIAILKTLQPPKKKADPEYDLLTRRRLEDMRVTLSSYTQPFEEISWRLSSLRAAHGRNRGPWYAKRLREWCRAYIADGSIPENLYGTWNESLLAHEDLAGELTIHLQSIGVHVRAQDIVDYLSLPEVQERWKIKKAPSLATAQRWMKVIGYRWEQRPSGMYVDGHERKDVVDYRQKVFLPALSKILPYTQCWKDGEHAVPENVVWPEDVDDGPRPMQKAAYVLWYHDESTFYANDRRKVRWVHRSEKALPLPKGEGASLMVSDFVSADYGFLVGARRIFRAGKNRDGYFTNEDIIEQVRAAMKILKEQYPDQKHVFIYDNATTHLKREPGAPSATNMPKGVSNPKNNWMVDVNETDDRGKPVYEPDGSLKKKKIPMKSSGYQIKDKRTGEWIPQSFYWPDDDKEYPGLFKGMAQILEERGYQKLAGLPPKGKLGVCKDFAQGCKAANRPDCCCRRMLYNEPDFKDPKSFLERVCESEGFLVLILPKFHCELNFIEQCWGYAKRVYRRFPPSKQDADLERNVLASLEAIPLQSMRRFAVRALRFCDAYMKGLDGKQAAWASKKYRGHRTLPSDWKKELKEAGVTRFDGTL